MTIDITIGKKQHSAPMFTCKGAGFDGCAGEICRECLQLVQQERRADAPPIHTATAQGLKVGGYNFLMGLPIGMYFRWLDETRIDERYPWLRPPSNDPMTFSIPDTLPGVLHRLAVEIEMGIVKTAYPQQDAEFTCWFAWWSGFAARSYGLQAAIQFS
jgi:hypothetical protein